MYTEPSHFFPLRYNWMILDSVLMLYEAGHNVLPNNMNPLKQGWVAPPTTMDGIPAPLSITVNPEDTIIAKVRVYHNSTNKGRGFYSKIIF